MRGFLREGDFPAFYAAAVIVASGRAEDLYDADLQREIQQRHWPEADGEFLYYAYPPYVAAVLKPLALLNPQDARHLWSIASLALYASTVLLLLRINPPLRRHALFTAALGVIFAPAFAGLLGGQNTPLSMLLYAALLTGLAAGTARGEIAAGFALGVWGFKPHFAAVALLLPLLTGRKLALAAAAIPAFVYYLLGASLNGWSWPAKWLAAISRFGPADLAANGRQMVSLPSLGEFYGYAWAGYFAAACLLVWWITRVVRGRAYSREHAMRAAALGTVICLASPHTLFYDLGIAWTGALAVLRLESDRAVIRLGALLAVAGALTVVRSDLTAPLLTVIPLALLAAFRGRGIECPAKAASLQKAAQQ